MNNITLTVLDLALSFSLVLSDFKNKTLGLVQLTDVV